MPVYCPHCGKSIKVAQCVVLAGFNCPRCSKYSEVRRNSWQAFPPPSAQESRTESPTAETSPFAPDSNPLPASDPAVIDPLKVDSLLTSPHACHQCKGPIETPTGFRRSTINCPKCQNRTSVYAVFHLCRYCGILLESPTHQQGCETRCPRCGQSQEVPHDVLERKPPDPEDEDWFGVDCGNCGKSLAANKEHVGMWAVCPECLVTMEVPHSGYHLSNAGRARSPLDPLHSYTEKRCPNCGNHIPTRAVHCPLCGAPNLPHPQPK